ncbi:MAG: branched-chain amino acid ABC transporter permease [Burkholderiales bacterium]|nr:branched-chain amino acid ABC transporter permease [Burkholderiales bacterium]
MSRDLAGIAALLAASGALAVSVEGYTLHRFTMAGVFAIAICGLNLLTGLSRLLSIGHGALYAVGAYAVAIGMRVAALDAYLCVPLAGALAFGAGFVFGLPVVRFGLVHLALATWALALALPQFLKSSLVSQWTGGVQGLYIDRPGVPAGLPLSEDQWWFAVVMAVLAVALWSLRNLRDSRSGRALQALADQPLAAQAMGVDLVRTRALVFAASGAYAGVAGALGALLTDFVGPDSYGTWFSIELLVGAVVGGLYSAWGALFGGLLMKFLPDFARGASGLLTFPAHGLLLIAMVWFLPRGLAGLLELRRRPPGAGPRTGAQSR